MGLSEHELRLLEEMERGLYASEADSLGTDVSATTRPSYRAMLVGALGVLVGLAGLVAAVATGHLWIAIVSFVIMLAAVLYTFTPGNQIVASGQEKSTQSRESLADKAQRRWEERMEGDR